ncbi:MAG: HipA domain-containing protein [Clostridia bacterium]|nr:HipA domain-containing protein [Clostridia bacterium]MDY5554643.1 HipA domain-containing protein [Blautia sp.]
MNCLCCQKPLRNGENSGWHKSCIKKFFGTSRFPEIEISEEALELLTVESTSRGYTVPGVQKKLSLHLFSEKNRSRLTLVNYPAGYILKPQVEEFESLPEAEQLVMCMADSVGISTVPHALVKGSGSLAYITRRVDRVFEKNNVRILAMEDFCQLDLRLTQDKYKGSYERCAKIIERYSSQRGLDMTELYMRLIFSFVIGNSDMHLKNFSLIETYEGSGKYVLSPAYDLLPVNVIMPEDKEQFALALNGKKRNIHRKDFLIFADSCNISRASAEKMIAKVVSMKDKFIIMCRDSFLPEHLQERFVALIEERTDILEKRVKK